MLKFQLVDGTGMESGNLLVAAILSTICLRDMQSQVATGYSHNRPSTMLSCQLLCLLMITIRQNYTQNHSAAQFHADYSGCMPRMTTIECMHSYSVRSTDINVIDLITRLKQQKLEAHHHSVDMNQIYSSDVLL